MILSLFRESPEVILKANFVTCSSDDSEVSEVMAHDVPMDRFQGAKEPLGHRTIQNDPLQR